MEQRRVDAHILLSASASRHSLSAALPSKFQVFPLPNSFSTTTRSLNCLQCFDTVGWVAGRASGTVFCVSKIQIGFTFLVPAHLGSPGKRAVKWACVFQVLEILQTTPPNMHGKVTVSGTYSCLSLQFIAQIIFYKQIYCT